LAKSGEKIVSAYPGICHKNRIRRKENKYPTIEDNLPIGCGAVICNLSNPSLDSMI
jgi:hypothetical protein